MNRNTILENAPKLPDGLKWYIISVHLVPFHASRLYSEISDFDTVIFKQEDVERQFWLVELIRDGVIYFGFVKMVRK